MLFIFNSRLVWRHNDVIMGNMKGLVTLLFFKIKSTNLASWGILMQIFQKKLYNSKFNTSMASVWRHNRYFSKPCNFAIFEGISSNFGKLGYFNMFIKVSVFHKYCFIYWYFIAENVFDTNDVIMKVHILFLAMRTDHRVSRKWKLLSISDLLLVYPNNEIKTQKVANLTFYDVTVTS